MLQCFSGKAKRPRALAAVGSPTGATILLILLVFSLNTAVAAPLYQGVGTYNKEEGQIPQSPTAPPALSQPKIIDMFHCDRTFVYKGKALTCDSNVQQDGERLRPILEDTPEAMEQFTTYQRNRRNLKNVAYMTSVGVATILAGYLISRPPVPDVTIRNGGYLVLAGAGIAIGSLAYALAPVSKDDDTHMTKAAYILGVGIASILAGYLLDHPPLEGGTIKPGGYLVLSGLTFTIGSFAYGLSLSRTNETYLGSAIKEYNRAHSNQPIELQFSTGIKF
jgi:hypothetical protein